MLDQFDKVTEAAAFIAGQWAPRPAVGIILGSGLGGVTGTITDKVTIPYDSIPQPLFENVGPARNALNDSLDAINKKYGKNTLYLGTAWNALSSAPMRIAFNHIPDLEVDDDE